MYRETLQSQWDGLCVDFSEEYPSLLLRGEPPCFFQEWYHTRIHRWNSVVYTEGVLLDQVANETFATALRTCMGEFRFKKTEKKKTSPMWIGPVMGLALAAVAVMIASFLLHWSIFRSAIVGLILFVLTITGYTRNIHNAIDKDSERIQDAYVQQLRDYWPQLEAICRDYAVR